MLDILALLTNYWLDEFIVVLLAGALLLGVEVWVESKKRAEIEITPASSGDRLGFKVATKRKPLNHPRILFYGGWTRLSWSSGDLHPCDLYDEDGNIYKEDYILVGRPIRIFPLIAKNEFGDDGDRYTLTVRVSDAATKREVITNVMPGVPKISNLGFSPKREPKPSPHTQVSIQVIADGMDREEVFRFHVALETLIVGFVQGSSFDQTIVSNSLLIRREPWLWRRL